jgi:opine dehydrogenase
VTHVAILGAGNGGLAAAADLAQRSHEVTIWNRSPAPIEAIEGAGGIRTRGALGNGLVAVHAATTDIDRALKGVDVVMVVLPATAHAAVARSLARGLEDDVPIVLNPGHMCGSLHFRRVFADGGRAEPAVVELGTLTYVCRSLDAASVDVYLVTRDVPIYRDARVRAALTTKLVPSARPVGSPLEAWLHDVNMVLHPPGMILGASWIEHTGGGFRFYADGVTPAVATLMDRLDAERRAVGRAFGIELPDLAHTMAAFGTAGDVEQGTRAAVRSGEANRAISAPSSLDSRYVHEDVAFGLVPLMALAAGMGVATPIADAITEIASALVGRDLREQGLNARRLGIEGAARARLEAVARGQS